MKNRQIERFQVGKYGLIYKHIALLALPDIHIHAIFSSNHVSTLSYLFTFGSIHIPRGQIFGNFDPPPPIVVKYGQLGNLPIKSRGHSRTAPHFTHFFLNIFKKIFSNLRM